MGVGASVGVTVVTGGSTAALDRNLTAGGAVDVRAETAYASTVEAEASAQGSIPEVRNADKEANNQVNANPNQGSDVALPSIQEKMDEGNTESKKESGNESAKVGVAASLSVNVISATNEARIGDGVVVSAGGAVAVRAVGGTDATAKAQGSTLSLDTEKSVGAGVSLNVAVVTNRASIGTGARVTGDSIAVEAVQPPLARDEQIAWGLAAAGGKDDGVGGSIAVNVGVLRNEAVVGSGATLRAQDGDISVRASQVLGVQGIAAAAGFGQNDAGVGAAAAVNVIDRDTRAVIGDGATVDATGTTLVLADASLERIVVDAPVLPDEADPGVTAVAMSGGISQGGTAVGGSVALNVFLFDTEAIIGAGAQVNKVLAGGAGQDVTVAAKDVSFITNVAGALAASYSGVGVGIGLDVNTDGDFSLLAEGDETVISTAASLGLSGGSSAVGGSVSVQVFVTGTRAALEGVRGNGVAVATGGDATVFANADFDATMVAGSFAFGTNAGVGVSNSTLVHTDTVEALVGDSSEITVGGDIGLSVDALSTERVITIAAAGAGSSTAGVAGSAAVSIYNEVTRALIGPGVTLTLESAGASAPGVRVQAQDNTEQISVTGSVAGGSTAGVGAGAGVTSLTKRTDAAVSSGVTADVEGSMRVESLTREQLTGVAGAVGIGGTAGVAGATGISVIDVITRAFVGDDPADSVASRG
ncbi:MAG: hypothetical protein B7Z52_04205, partial [Burkholderiales bacterium 12-64-5]